jgi:predicted nucleic acid-binding protein
MNWHWRPGLPDLICDSSPIQYLYQLKLLHIIPKLANQVFVPPAVIEEIRKGHSLGVNLPELDEFDWVTVRRPISELALPLIANLGPGETEVLMLALEMREAVAVLDDALAREMAETLDLHLTGTLGLLLDAKKTGLIPALRPLLDELQSLRFRLAPRTYSAILRLAGESVIL